jgi:starvation-inducible DNA-binding protein
MRSTHNSLDKKTRSASIDVLQDRLSDALDAWTHSKQAHWNVRGPAFIAIHELFDKVAASVEDSADDIAERLATLGGSPRGTAREVGRASSLKEYPLKISRESDHVAALSRSISTLATNCREAIDTTARLGDPVTADLFTRVAGELDKLVWFIESHER